MSILESPAGVVMPRDAREVADAVREARAAGLGIAPHRTGRTAGRLSVQTARMTGVEVDAAARRARVGAGATWADLIAPAAASGLAALHGAPGAGIVGDCLGGGLSWYARKYGLAANHVVALEVVLADGALVRATADDEPALFWALRGGGGSFGVVCALELCLLPIRSVYAGTLRFDRARAADVLRTWRALLPGLPEEMTSAARVEPSGVSVEAVYLGTERGGAALLAPLRALGPQVDSFAVVAPAALGGRATAGARLLRRTDLPVADGVELRHTGGALARSAEHHGALDTLPGELAVTGPVAVDALPRFHAETSQLLSAVKAALDPADVIRATHPSQGTP